jgi:hypothetical protein
VTLLIAGTSGALEQRSIGFAPLFFAPTKPAYKDSRKRDRFIFFLVIPAKAGIQNQAFLNSGFPTETFGNDKRK